MKCTKFFALAAVVALVSGCDGDATFDPAGNWSFGEYTVTGSSTYVNAEHDVSVDYEIEELLGATPAPTMLTFDYNDVASQLIVSGTPYTVTNRVATISDMTTGPAAVPGFDCTLTEYARNQIAFNADGSEGTVRQVQGFSLVDTSANPATNCTAALAPAKAAFLAGTIPSDLETPTYLGLIKGFVLDQLRSFEYSVNVAGQNLSASSAADGTTVYSFEAEDYSAELAAKVAAIRAALGL